MANFGPKVLLLLALSLAGAGCSSAANIETVADPSTTTPSPTTTAAVSGPQLGLETLEAVVVNSYPHDAKAYTQGLEFVDGQLLESTGRVGESSLRLVEPTTGEVSESVAVGEVFAEGATVVGDEVWQLTWTEQTLIVYDLDGLNELRRQPYLGEGWGLCDDSEQLVMSNGSSELTFRDRDTFEVLNTVTVTSEGEPVAQLNELECVQDRVWANIWQSNRVIEIDPGSGNVTRQIDLTDLVPEQFIGNNDSVLNGIAYNADSGHFWLTGKRWPIMYEVDFVLR